MGGYPDWPNHLFDNNMITGWQDDDYLILFEEQADAIEMTSRYGILTRLPGHTLIGLCGWDDFILMTDDGAFATVPTIPLIPEEIQPRKTPIDLSRITSDERFGDKVKWYVQPIIFGGSPTESQNMIWVSIDEHIQLVRWWNDKYDEVKRR